MQDLIFYVWNFDNMAMFFVALLATWGGYMVHQMVSSQVMTLLFVPGFIGGALLSNYVFNALGIVVLHDKNSNSVVVTAIGMMFALVVLIIGIWATYTIGEAMRPSVEERRARQASRG